MTFSYDEARIVALELIAEFGAAASVVGEGVSGGLDPSTGDPIAAQSPTSISGTVTPIIDYVGAEIDGQTILMGDGYVFFHSDDTPLVGMTIAISGQTLRVMSIEDLTSVDGVNVYRKLQLRR